MLTTVLFCCTDGDLMFKVFKDAQIEFVIYISMDG